MLSGRAEHIGSAAWPFGREMCATPRQIERRILFATSAAMARQPTR
jgi:hypothetical protein